MHGHDANTRSCHLHGGQGAAHVRLFKPVYTDTSVRTHDRSGPVTDDKRLCVQQQEEAAQYATMLSTRKAEERERRSESLAKKRAQRMASQASEK